MALIKHISHPNPWQDLIFGGEDNFGFGEAFRRVARTAPWVPSASVEEQEERLVIALEVPGVSEDSVEIALENNILTISGEKQQEKAETEGKFHIRERSFGSFRRTFHLPRTIRFQDITADMANGVLTIRLPKAEEARVRMIQVQKPA